MENNDSSQLFTHMAGIATHTMPHNNTQTDDIQHYLLRFLAMTTDHIVILILLCALTLKYLFFDDVEELVDQALQNQQGSPRNNNLSPAVLRLLRKDKVVQTDSSDTTTLVSAACQTSHVLDPMEFEKDDSLSVETQTEVDPFYEITRNDESVARSVDECYAVYKELGSAESLTNQEICSLVNAKKILPRELEKVVKNPVRGVAIRRRLCGEKGVFQPALDTLPFEHYDYKQVIGKCCENVIGFIPVPLGLAGPLIINEKAYHLPMATTEGCLVASTSRGCKILNESGGVRCKVEDCGMTRAPVVRFPSVEETWEARDWINKNMESIKTCFNSTSAYARLQQAECIVAGRCMYIRFSALTGDAMGMNMVSKGAEEALKFIQSNVKDMEVLSLSGNVCTDKKPSAINWIKGRGKSVIVDATIPRLVVEKQLRTTSKRLEDLNKSKNLMGSCMAGSIGGFNAHAANIVTAVFIATGQDPAQNVGSSNCMTTFECEENGDLYVACRMPSLEVGTIGGGTALPAQAACLELLGVKGPSPLKPGENAKTLAQIIGGAVLAGELSLMAALSSGDLVKSHLTHNRTALSEKACSAIKRALHEPLSTKCAPS